MLLSNNWFYTAVLFFSVLFAFSCNEKEKNVPVNKIDLSTPESALREAKKILGNDVQISLTGTFDADTTKELVAGTEINKPDKWGIQFHLLKKGNESLDSSYSTDLLEGSFTDALVRKEKLPSENYDMVYYNSLDYYLGSGGGEVFSYLIDFNNRQTYYAHLFTEQGRNISLFLSENVTPDIKNFFLNIFKKDYRNFKIVNKDVDLDE